MYIFLESDEFDEIPIKLNKILEEVSNDVEHLPELQVSLLQSLNIIVGTKWVESEK